MACLAGLVLDFWNWVRSTCSWRRLGMEKSLLDTAGSGGPESVKGAKETPSLP